VNVSVKPHHDTVTLRPRADLHALLHGVQTDGGHIMSALFGDVRIDNPITYKVTGRLNQFAFAEVVALGGGSVTGQGRDRPDLEPGAIVGVDLGQIGHSLPGGVWHTTWRNLLCVFRPGNALPQPLMNRVMVEHDEKLIDRFVFQRSQLVSAKVGRSDVKTNDRAKTKVGVALGRVIGTGKGRYVRKAFEAIGVTRGEVVAFEPTNGVVDFMFERGRLLKFVPWSEVLFSVEGLDA
jgi:co-chaperonin GroES (HSP10)